MITKPMKLFSTNHVQLFKHFSGVRRFKELLPQKKGIEVSRSLKNGIQDRTIKTHPWRTPLEDDLKI